MLYREPKLLKAKWTKPDTFALLLVSVLYREPKLLKVLPVAHSSRRDGVSVLYREPKLLKAHSPVSPTLLSHPFQCSTREPKLLKAFKIYHPEGGP